jgi:hypothetical protein
LNARLDFDGLELHALFSKGVYKPLMSAYKMLPEISSSVLFSCSFSDHFHEGGCGLNPFQISQTLDLLDI